METTAMRSAAATADPAGSGPDSPTQPLGITDPLSLTPRRQGERPDPHRGRRAHPAGKLRQHAEARGL